MEIMLLFISLIRDAAALMAVSYLITRAGWFEAVLERRLDRKTRLSLVLSFGLLSVYGTLSGLHIGGAVANIRYIGPVVAGLLGGPLVGLGAGLVGGIHRFCFTSGLSIVPSAEFTRFTSSLSTVVAGLAAGIFHHLTTRRNGRFIGIGGAVLFAAGVQVYHLGQILLLEKPFARAAALIRVVSLPMVVANAAGTAIFFLIMHNLLRERETRAQRDQYLSQKQKIEGELSVAREIQMSMVPKMFPKTPSWPECELFASLRSAREVGGDLYDFFLDEEGKLVFAVGDVSDKGVPAALFMAVTKTLIKALSAPGLPPHELLERLNAELTADNDSMMFVTLFVAKLDFATGELLFSNAGHNPPILVRRGGAAEWLALPPGLVLGAEPESRYRTGKTTLRRGDLLVAYTDGVTEAMNRAHEFYSNPRLLSTVNQAAGSSPEQMVHHVAQSVDEYAGGELQSDDITLLAVRYKGVDDRQP